MVSQYVDISSALPGLDLTEEEDKEGVIGEGGSLAHRSPVGLPTAPVQLRTDHQEHALRSTCERRLPQLNDSCVACVDQVKVISMTAAAGLPAWLPTRCKSAKPAGRSALALPRYCSRQGS